MTSSTTAPTTQDETVLVTGGSGFLAVHCILQALQLKYHVRATLRTPERAEEIREMLRCGGASTADAESVQFIPADLTKDAGWEDACAGCTYVLHLAAPVLSYMPADENELIRPAREGTLRVLRAAKAAGTVKRVVLASSTAAIGYGHASRTAENPFTEEVWTDLAPSKNIAPQQKCKTLAERAAWDFVEKEGDGMELTVINPSFIFGPTYGKHTSASLGAISKLLDGSSPGIPQINMGVVDVRDCADLHLRAMTNPNAAGERFIASGDDAMIWYKDVAQILREGLSPEEAARIPTMVIPDFFVRAAAKSTPSAAIIAPMLGVERLFSNKKAKDTFGWQPRCKEETILSTAQSLKQYGVIKT
jgi:dihydroflavonol-4-reductase